VRRLDFAEAEGSERRARKTRAGRSEELASRELQVHRKIPPLGLAVAVAAPDVLDRGAAQNPNRRSNWSMVR
jgi:hypothetical protein